MFELGSGNIIQRLLQKPFVKTISVQRIMAAGTVFDI